MEIHEYLLENLTNWVEYLDSDPPIDSNENFCRLRSNRPNWTSYMCGVYWKFSVELTGESFVEEPTDAVERKIKSATDKAVANSTHFQGVFSDAGNPQVVKVDTREPVDTLAEMVEACAICTLKFDGWSTDRREIAEIPKAKNYLKEFIDKFPQLYSVLNDESKFVVMVAWCGGKAIRKDFTSGHVDWAIDQNKRSRFLEMVSEPLSV